MVSGSSDKTLNVWEGRYEELPTPLATDADIRLHNFHYLLKAGRLMPEHVPLLLDTTCTALDVSGTPITAEIFAAIQQHCPQARILAEGCYALRIS